MELPILVIDQLWTIYTDNLFRKKKIEERKQDIDTWKSHVRSYCTKWMQEERQAFARRFFWNNNYDDDDYSGWFERNKPFLDLMKKLILSNHLYRDITNENTAWVFCDDWCWRHMKGAEWLEMVMRDLWLQPYLEQGIKPISDKFLEDYFLEKHNPQVTTSKGQYLLFEV